MKGDIDVFFVIALLIVALFGVVAGCVANDPEWRQDCEKLGATRSAGNIYDCKLRAKP